MKFFERDGKYNFVDLNNAFVGFDSTQDCCENADWFIADTPQEDANFNGDCPQELPGYTFDPDYFHEVENPGHVSDGGMVIFRLTSTNGIIEKYLHLFNCHNGYYGHGFTFEVGGETKQSGVL